MGAVLAMKHPKALIPLAALTALALTGCGPLNEGNVSRGFLAIVKSRMNGTGAAATPAPPAMTRAQADANPGAFLLVTAYGGASVASLVKASSNGPRDTWISADSVTVTLENGIIVATRGFPRDLIAADVRGVRQAIAAGRGTASRVHETITDLDQISTELLQCSIVSDGTETIAILGKNSQTTRVRESCRGETLAFTNTYWVDAAGGILRSTQAVSPVTGFLQLDRL